MISSNACIVSTLQIVDNCFPHTFLIIWNLFNSIICLKWNIHTPTQNNFNAHYSCQSIEISILRYSFYLGPYIFLEFCFCRHCWPILLVCFGKIKTNNRIVQCSHSNIYISLYLLNCTTVVCILVTQAAALMQLNEALGGVQNFKMLCICCEEQNHRE